MSPDQSRVDNRGTLDSATADSIRGVPNPAVPPTDNLSAAGNHFHHDTDQAAQSSVAPLHEQRSDGRPWEGMPMVPWRQRITVRDHGGGAAEQRRCNKRSAKVSPPLALPAGGLSS